MTDSDGKRGGDGSDGMRVSEAEEVIEVMRGDGWEWQWKCGG